MVKIRKIKYFDPYDSQIRAHFIYENNIFMNRLYIIGYEF
jgi:hypothetical protein